MAQSVERRIGNAEVGGSIPLGSLSDMIGQAREDQDQTGSGLTGITIKYRGVAQFG